MRSDEQNIPNLFSWGANEDLEELVDDIAKEIGEYKSPNSQKHEPIALSRRHKDPMVEEKYGKLGEKNARIVDHSIDVHPLHSIRLAAYGPFLEQKSTHIKKSLKFSD